MDEKQSKGSLNFFSLCFSSILIFPYLKLIQTTMDEKQSDNLTLYLKFIILMC